MKQWIRLSFCFLFLFFTGIKGIFASDYEIGEATSLITPDTCKYILKAKSLSLPFSDYKDEIIKEMNSPMYKNWFYKHRKEFLEKLKKLNNKNEMKEIWQQLGKSENQWLKSIDSRETISQKLLRLFDYIICNDLAQAC